MCRNSVPCQRIWNQKFIPSFFLFWCTKLIIFKKMPKIGLIVFTYCKREDKCCPNMSWKTKLLSSFSVHPLFMLLFSLQTLGLQHRHPLFSFNTFPSFHPYLLTLFFSPSSHSSTPPPPPSLSPFSSASHIIYFRHLREWPVCFLVGGGGGARSGGGLPPPPHLRPWWEVGTPVPTISFKNRLNLRDVECCWQIQTTGQYEKNNYLYYPVRSIQREHFRSSERSLAS
jgi:hypothetical protein